MGITYTGLSLEGKVALVTGSARGIGETLAVGLAQAGADVAISDLEERLSDAQGVQQNIKQLGRQSNSYVLNVQDVSQIEESINRICLLYTSPSPRDGLLSRMPSSA